MKWLVSNKNTGKCLRVWDPWTKPPENLCLSVCGSSEGAEVIKIRRLRKNPKRAYKYTTKLFNEFLSSLKASCYQCDMWDLFYRSISGLFFSFQHLFKEALNICSLKVEIVSNFFLGNRFRNASELANMGKHLFWKGR